MDIIKIVIKKCSIRGRTREISFVFGYSKIFAENLVACREGDYNIVDTIFNSRDNYYINNIDNLFVCNFFCTSSFSQINGFFLNKFDLRGLLIIECKPTT